MKKIRSKPRSRRSSDGSGRGEREGNRSGNRGPRRSGPGPTNYRGPTSRYNSGPDSGSEVRSTRTRTGTFEDLFAGTPKDVKAIGERLREIVFEVLPGSKETVYLGWKIALYSDPSEVCGIQPVQGKYCNLYFSNGANMKDPEGLLEGTGKSIRHVKIRSADDIPVDPVMNLIREAKRLAK